MKERILLLIFFILAAHFPGSIAAVTESTSLYKLRPSDPEAVYFTSDNFRITSDGIGTVYQLGQKKSPMVGRLAGLPEFHRAGPSTPLDEHRY